MLVCRIGNQICSAGCSWAVPACALSIRGWQPGACCQVVLRRCTGFAYCLQENIRRNFGMPQPNGYRKAMRFMRHANKFGLPIVTFVDTPGAYAGKSAEELGQVSNCTRGCNRGWQLHMWPGGGSAPTEVSVGPRWSLAVPAQEVETSHVLVAALQPTSCLHLLEVPGARRLVNTCALMNNICCGAQVTVLCWAAAHLAAAECNSWCHTHKHFAVALTGLHGWLRCAVVCVCVACPG